MPVRPFGQVGHQPAAEPGAEPRGVGAQTVLTVHDLLLFDRPDDFPAPKRLLLGRPYAASLRQADTPVCVSAATRDRLVRWDPRLTPRAAAASTRR